MEIKFKVVNIVATMNTGFRIRIEKLSNNPYLLYVTDNGRYVAIKPPNASKQITIFSNGNMITVGNKSIAEAKRNLLAAKKFLRKFAGKT